MSSPYQNYLNEWQPDFKTRAIDYKAGPNQNRILNDITCLIIFILFLLGFIIIGAYCINQGWKSYSSSINKTYFLNAELSNNLGKILGIIIGMLIISIVLAFIFIMLINSFPTCMVYIVISLVSLFIVIFSIICFAYGSISAGVMILVILATYILMIVCCLRQYVQTAIILCKLSAHFILNYPIIYLLPIIICLFTFLFSVYWLASIIGVAQLLSTSSISIDAGNGLYFILVVFYLFFTYFFYYMMVFLNSSSVAIWFYNKLELKILWSGFDWLFKYHIGSITFASFIITVIKIIQLFLKSSQTQNKNCCTTVCMCMVQCCLKIIEGFVRTMNHYSTIVMSVTGQSFLASAKTTGVILFSNIGLFAIVDIISAFFFYSGLFFIVILPTFISIIIANTSSLANEGGIIASLVFFLSIMIGVIILSLFTESMSAIFIFYCLELKLANYGMKASNIQDEIKQLYAQAFPQYSQGYVQPQIISGRKIYNTNQ